MTMSKVSVSSTLQCWVTVSSPRPIVTSTPPKEWIVRPSPTLMATVLVLLKPFSRRRATMESVAPVDGQKIQRASRALILSARIK